MNQPTNNWSPPSVPTAPAQRAGLNGPSLWTLIGGAALILGSFLPWAKAISIFGTIEVSGFDGGDGKLTAVVGGIIVLLIVATMQTRGRQVFGVTLALAVIGGAIAMYDWVNVNSKVNEANSSDAAFRAQVGIGIYLCIAGAVMTLCASIAALKRPANPS
jgi:hypothetical protein